MPLDNCHDRRNVSTVSRTNFYQRPNTPPTTAWARHLDAIAQEKGLSQSGLAEWLHDAVGLGPKSRTAFRPYLQGKEPTKEQAQALAAIVGWPPAEPNPPVIVKLPADPMERIAAAVEDIARTLASLQTDMAGQSGATIGAVQTLGAQLTAILDRRLGV